MLWVLIAQTDTLSGGGGWLGAGLLGLVLGWLLLKHLPEKDRQFKEFLDGKDSAIAQQAKEHKEAVEALTKCHEAEQEKTRVAFEKAMEVVTAHCKEETRQMIEVFTKEVQRKKP